MELLNMIPAPIWALLAIGFAFWYVFMRGKKKSSRRGLSQLRRDEESTRRELSIEKNREKIQEIKDKKREKAKKRGEDWLK